MIWYICKTIYKTGHVTFLFVCCLVCGIVAHHKYLDKMIRELEEILTD